MSTKPGSAVEGRQESGWYPILARYRLALVVALFVILLDQSTKAIIKQTMSQNESFPVVNGLFNITRIFNTGAAFGFLANITPSLTRPILVAVSVLAIGFLLFALRQLKGRVRLGSIALGLVLGGATGNLVDRLLFGGVVDFLDFHWRGVHWPAFNVADSSITIGMVLFLLSMQASEPKG